VSRPSKASKTPPLLRVRGLTKKFGDVEVLSGVDLTVTAGKAVALRGRNGAGKSTLLLCVTGVDAPTSGTVELDGEPVDERSVRVRRDLAIVLDDMDFFPDLSVIEHLDVFARAHGVEDAEKVVDEVLEEVRLTPQAAQLPGTLSSGQKRRLALASAFVRPRRLLVLDEPEARLDEAGLVWLTDRLLREKAAGLGILLASHDPDLVAAVADRVHDLDEPSP
jgi:ABC-type multidrug transport system ATPase subunit